MFLTTNYRDIWAKPFGVGHTPKTAWDLKNEFGHMKNKNICFRQIAVGIYGPAMPFTVHSRDTTCQRSAIARAYSDFIIKGLNLQANTHYAEKTPSKIVNIVFLARRSSSEWPEKRFCNDTTSFFLCDLWKDWGIRSLQRQDNDEHEVLVK